MTQIKVLSKELQEIIAAGEVVERPSAVVKELVENSLDAKSSEITVNVKDGGRSLIEVIDNGVGIEHDDLELSVNRFTTSKISSTDDLNSIQTFGFRGEALSAISAVSKFKIESRTNFDDCGRRILIESGKNILNEEIGCSVGTSVSVSDLFYNTPARWKFLRGKSSEMAQIKDIFLAFAVSNPDVRFILNHDEKRILTLNHSAESKRISDIFDSELLAIDSIESGIKIHGYLFSNNNVKLKNSGMFFVNKRYVFDKIIRRAVIEAVSGYYGRDEIPSTILFIDIDPSMVDVNVHPTKREVKFLNTQTLFHATVNAVRSVLVDKHLSVFNKSNDAGVSSKISYDNSMKFNREITPVSGQNNSSSFEYYRPNSPFRPLGQISATYVVCEGENGDLIIIDQHAAHERLCYDKLKTEFESGSVLKQSLLFPEVINLSQSSAEDILRNIDLLLKLGFEMEKTDGNSFFVRTVPAVISGKISNLASLFSSIAEDLHETLSKLSFDEVVNKVLATIACHRQIRAGKTLSSLEMERLVCDVSNEKITHCPHGRPALVQFKKSELDKWFNRK